MHLWLAEPGPVSKTETGLLAVGVRPDVLFVQAHVISSLLSSFGSGSRTPRP